MSPSLAVCLLSTPPSCPAEAHAPMLANAQAMMNLTTPGARTADPELTGCWNELRHCVACQGTLTYQGGGVSKRWVYGVTDPVSQASSFANTLEDAVTLVLEGQLTLAAVSRFQLEHLEHEQLTTGELFWLRDALTAEARR